jgi:type VI secretion system protein ImpB
MAKKESVQKRLQKVRAPRVQMTYDVEIGDAIENKELPFVVGVVGDFGGDPAVAKCSAAWRRWRRSGWRTT